MEEDKKEKVHKFIEGIEECGLSDCAYSKDSQCEMLRSYITNLEKENTILKEYICVAPNLDEMTAVKYSNIQRDAYFRGRAEEQQRAEEIIYNNYIPKLKLREKIEEYDSIGMIGVARALQELLEEE